MPVAIFAVPSLGDVDKEYAALLAKRSELATTAARLCAEQRKLRAAPSINGHKNPDVARLLGDEIGADNTVRLAEITTELRAVEIAQAEVERRLNGARSRASRAVCETVRPEFAARAKAVLTALKALDSARKAYEALRSDLESEDVQWTSLGPVNLTGLDDLIHRATNGRNFT